MSDKIIIGREEEKLILDEAIDNDSADLVAVYGRRRVGKTFLIRTHLKKHITFEFSGIHNVSTDTQLLYFSKALHEQFHQKKKSEIQTWFDAFDLLAKLIAVGLKKKSSVIFLDEFPWMQTPKSNFLSAFENFWNTWASKQNNLTIILCGSAASWMLKNVIHNKGGLHNRITQKISLMPFTLAETELFLKSKKIQLNRKQITQLYMTMGGVPHYLGLIKPGFSAAQIIEKECFSKNGFLVSEFSDLFKALFDDAERHVKVVKVLAAKPSGLNRTQLIKACKLQSGGSTTSLLEELSASGFITSYIPFGKKSKDSIYKLTDEYCLFYLKFIEPNRSGIKGTWLRLSDTPSYKSWSGFAFETICLKHTHAIKKALGIDGIYSLSSIWRATGTKITDGSQIDLLIDRKDGCINICELKFTEGLFSINKKYANQLLQKKLIFKQQTKTKKQLFITMVTNEGVILNENSLGLIDNQIKLDSLFSNISNE